MGEDVLPTNLDLPRLVRGGNLLLNCYTCLYILLLVVACSLTFNNTNVIAVWVDVAWIENSSAAGADARLAGLALA